MSNDEINEYEIHENYLQATRIRLQSIEKLKVETIALPDSPEKNNLLHKIELAIINLKSKIQNTLNELKNI